jgi:ATP-binding cassette subfamily C protein
LTHSLESGFNPARARKTPTVLQMEATECGAAALGSILGFHGRYIPLAVLRDQCGVSRNGSNALNVIKAARLNGLTAQGFRRSVSDLSSISLPAILYWSFDHFVVLEGFTKKYAVINDPASGRRKITRDEFGREYTGVVLTFTPGADFSKTGRKPGIWGPLRERLSGCGNTMRYAVLAGLLLVVPGLALPAIVRVFVDKVLVQGMTDWLPAVLCVMGLAAIVQTVISWLQRNFLLRLRMFISARGSRGFLMHLLKLGMSFYYQRYPGDLANRVQMNDTLAQLLSGELAVTLINVVTLLFFAALMFLYNPILALIALLFGGVNLAALRMVSCWRIDLNHKIRQEESLLMGISMSGLQMIESIKASGLENDFLGRWTEFQTRLAADQQQLTLSTQLVTILPPFLTLLATTAVLFVGGREIIAGTMTVGTLAAFNALMIAFMNPLTQIVGMGSTLQNAHASIERLEDVMQQPAVERNWSETGGEPVRGDLVMKDVSFRHSPAEGSFIENFNMRVSPGKRVAIVGRTGSGKSTLALLAAGIYSPNSGTVTLGGTLLNRIPASQLARSMAMVNQEVILFQGTVEDNLTLWKEGIPASAIEKAASDACISSVIHGRQGGYSSLVQEGGANFSGGEKQRIEIARALLGEPGLLILDEATSALDPPVEKEIVERINARGCACILIAHRLSTVRDCSEIIVMDNGQVSQRGTHDQLMSEGGLYSELVSEQ